MILYDSKCNKESPLASEYENEKQQCLKYFVRWPEQDQVQFVKNLLSRMCHQQHNRINNYLTPMLQRDFISLSTRNGIHHVAEKILSYLDVESLCHAEQVCKEWHRVTLEGSLWKKLIKRNVIADPVWRCIAEKRGWMQYLFERKRLRLDPGHFSYKSFQKVFQDMERIDDRWTNGQFHLQKIDCQSPSIGVYCLQYDGYKIVSGLRDNTIKIWDKHTLQCTQIFEGHTGSVLCLQYDERMIISGSSDRDVRVWNASTGQTVNILNQHTDSVLHLRFLNGVLVTCSKDRSIAVWDIVSPTEITLRRVLNRHRGAVNVVEFDEQYIVSASGDRSIKLWKTSTGEFVRSFRGHERGITSLQYKNNLIISGSSDNTIRLWAVSGLCLRTLEGHESLVRCLRFNEKYIVSGDYDGKIKLWDLVAAFNPDSPDSTLCLQTFKEHTDSVFAMQFDRYQMVSSSRDDTILVWDFLNYQGSGNDINIDETHSDGNTHADAES